ncbi:MAG TPA: branched-chain amino acid transaminase [Thermomicrobiales bacterium]
MSIQYPQYLWLNGELRRWEEGTIHISELGWSTVGAVFEGIRAYWNEEREELYVFRLREHLERLHRSMKLVRLPIDYSIEELTQAIVDLLRANNPREDTYIFPLAYHQDSYASRYDLPQLRPAIHIWTKRMPSHLGTGMTMTARVSSWRRISEDVMPPRVKNLSNYRNGQLARMEAALDGYNTALLLNSAGKVAEAPGACVMLVRNGRLITPDLTSSILESITRDALLTLAREELRLPVEERTVDRTELYVADEVFLCGTAAEISPIVSIDKYTIGNGEIGPVTRELDSLFARVVRGQETKYDHWRTPVGALTPAAARV